MAANDVEDALVEAMGTVGIVNTGAGDNNPAREMLSYMGIIEPPHLLNLKPEDVKDTVKAYNRDPTTNWRMASAVESKFVGFIYWAHDRFQRGIDTVDNNGDLQDFDEEVLFQMMSQYEADLILKKNSLDPSAVPKFTANGNWVQWKESFMVYLKQIAGATGCSLFWITRPDKGADWDPDTDAVDAVECRIYQIQRSGPWFDQDKRTVFNLLHTATRANITAWTWVQPYEATADGYEAWVSLTGSFDGPAEKSRREAEALNVLRDGRLQYRGEIRGGEMAVVIAKLRQSYQTLEEDGTRVIPDSDKVQKLYNTIVSTNSQVAMERTLLMSNFRNDFEGACRHISARVVEIFPNAGRINGPGRRINAVRGQPEVIDGIPIPDIEDIPLRIWRNLSERGRSIVMQKRRSLRTRRGHGPSRSNRPGGRGRGQFHGRGRGHHNTRGRSSGRGNSNHGGRFGGRGGGYRGGNNYRNNRNDNNGNNGNDQNRQIQNVNAPANNNAHNGAIVPYNPAQGGQNQAQPQSNGTGNDNANNANSSNNGNRGGQAGRGFGRGLYQNF